jgi:uncharacterized protein
VLVLSHYQITPLLAAHRHNKPIARTSTDLNLTTVEVGLDAEGIRFPDGERITWEHANKIAKNVNACFAVQEGQIEKVQTFSELTNRPYSLYPTANAPTLLVAGFPMHRIQGTDPHRDTLAKVRALEPVSGRVLDTATGLGYTAIELAKTADAVVTIELDPAAQEICRANPWSHTLFEHPNITRHIGDSFEIVPTLESNSFDAILHDPPTLSLAGELYSAEFYRELYRVLRHGARLLHYVEDPESRFGANVTRGVMERLKYAGFTRLAKRPQAFGILAYK